MMTQWQFYREVLRRAYRGGYSWAHTSEVVVAIILGALVFIPTWESWLKPLLAIPFGILVLHVLVGPYYYAYTIYRESAATPKTNTGTLTDEIRKQGSRKFGTKLQTLHDELFPQWQDAIRQPDRDKIHHTLDQFYERLKNLVLGDDDGKVLHLKAWGDIVDLMQEVNTWKAHTRSASIRADVGTGLFTELDRLAKAFPKEAGPVVPEKRGTTPIQFCGQELRSTHDAYQNGWKEAKEENNRAKGDALISIMNTALSTLMNNYRDKITPDDRWPQFMELREQATALATAQYANEFFFRDGDLVFYQMRQIAHAFQLRPDPLP
jgi:hypothetical protein